MKESFKEGALTRTSWIKRQKAFYVLLSIIFLLHLGTLLLHLRATSPQVIVDHQEKPLKVKLKKLTPFEFKKQIVESEDSERKERKETSYLSDKDRSFDRQTVARRIGVFKEGSQGGGAPAKRGQPKKELKLSDLGANVGEKHPLMKAAEEYARTKNSVAQGNGRTRQVSSSNDYVKDVPLGDMTNLNTAEYKYYGFYHRVRQRLEQFWGRSIQEKALLLAKMGRRVPASDELITALEITMNHVGEVVGIRLLGTSGIKELDDAAVDAFNEAGPFPNPPRGLVKNGRVKIEWGFVVNT